MCLICHVILQKLYERKLHSICIHPARFGCYSHCGSGYIMHLISYLTLQDHISKVTRDFMEGSFLLHIPILPSLVVIGIIVVDVKCLLKMFIKCNILVCHVISKKGMIIWSFDF